MSGKDDAQTQSGQDGRLSPDVGEMRLARVRAAVDHVLTTTRRGYQSQVEKLLNHEQLVAIGLMKAGGAKTEDIHATVIADFFGGDAENAPHYQALYRWLNRFGETYKRLRAVDHQRLMIEWHREQQGIEGLGNEANYGLARMAELVNAQMLDCDDLREFTNGQLGNFAAILAGASKAARESRKLDKAIDYTEQRMRLVELQADEREQKLEQARAAAEKARAELDQKSLDKSGQGEGASRTVDVTDVYKMLDDIMREVA